MSSEAQMWKDHVRPVLYTAMLDPHRIENAVALGMPDVNYLYGWIELKHKHEWPKRDDTPLRLTHFTPEQKTWLYRRHHLGGRAFLLLRVKNEFLLFDGKMARAVVGNVCRIALIKAALAYSPKGFDWDVFGNHLVPPEDKRYVHEGR